MFGAGRRKGSRNRKGRAVKGRCVGYGQQECNTRAGCSYANGAKRKFCRKSSTRRRGKHYTGSIDFGSSPRSSLNSILTSSSIRRPTRRHRRH